jgi:modulator of FtsH protease HflK
MQQVYSNVTKVMVDSRNNSNLLYLPLDKLLQQSSAPVNVVPAPQPADNASNQSSTVDVRSRDNQRGRDREGR